MSLDVDTDVYYSEFASRGALCVSRAAVVPKPIPLALTWMTQMTRIKSNRIFQLWEYTVSHQQLVVRSARDDENPMNIDLQFVGVLLLSMPVIFHGLTVEEGDHATLAAAGVSYSKPLGPNKIFAIKGGDGGLSVVIAAALNVEENELRPFESSLFPKPPAGKAR